ncbi:MAG TPA: chemotaxis protein CheB [Phycisphaerales bacterium]|nr:chemotaxis protein CheB [Phycisphaerales bacterium]
MSRPENSSHLATGGNDGLPPVAPDLVGQDCATLIDNIVPTRGYQMPPMVGIGASAGGIQALIEFFRAMPADTGLTFVVILHLSPTHDSVLDQLLGRATPMTVVQAEDGQQPRPNHVYVIPPGKYLLSTENQLRLVPFETERGKRVAVDMFFRSLADSHGPHAIGVVLSGVDGDGALGIKRVKERGGLTIAQDPGEAEHAGMPRSAINTGMVDWVLKAAEIPARLAEYVRNESRLQLPPEDGPAFPPTQASLADADEAALREILVFLRTRTGRDFACYKRATVLRRIARRMQVNGIEDLPGYVIYLRTHPGETGALLQDLLISVTNFFRDREAFDALERHIPRLFHGKSAGDAVRVWVPACATGEEAYSIAMLLLEHAGELDSPPSLQVFACDLSEEAIHAARAGHYPLTIETDVTETRLKRFFVKELDGYRVRRELREMVLFATHDLLKDAPFSRMDLISCRNLLIYLNREAQQRVIETFHFAMRPEGLLFLGTSESMDEGSPLFTIVDKKHRIYAHRPTGRASIAAQPGAAAVTRAARAHEEASAPPVVHGRAFLHGAAAAALQSKIGRELDRVSLSELHFRLVERYAPPSVVVNADHEVVHVSAHAGSFLKFAGGEPTTNLLRVVLPELRVELRGALVRAAEMGTTVEVFGVQAEVDGQPRAVDIRVAPAPEIAPGFLLVLFEARFGVRARGADVADSAPTTPDSAVRHLEQELERVKSNLRDTVEQYEASTEELKASNEELQAMNEELRSATEELETSREELQSINEELSTVNQEMKNKVEELAGANSDLQNLMASTSIATVFLDRGLTIMRYTPAAVAIFNIIPGDIGRPLDHLRHKLNYPDLIVDAERVLSTLVPVEREVSDGARWFLARLRPYRTVEDQIAGVVLTLVDVTERNRATEAQRESEERMRALIESAKDYAIFTLDKERRVDSWNTGARAIFGYADDEIIGKSGDVLFTHEDRAKGDPEKEARKAREQGRAENERWHLRKDGSVFYGSGLVMPLRDRTGAPRGYVKIMRDLTESKRAQEALREQMDELKRFNAAAVGREARMIELKKEINALCERIGEPPRYKVEG